MPTRKRRGFGRVERRDSGRYRASYLGPDERLHRAPTTFEASEDAEAWLADRRREIVNHTWNPPSAPVVKVKPVTFAEYAATWLDRRTLKPRSRSHYRSLLDRLVEPTFGDVPLGSITAEDVAVWHHKLGTATPTQRAHAYGLLRTILGSALQDRLIPYNPCHIRGAGNAKRVHKVKPLSIAELEALVEAMPESRRLMVLLAAWCALRFGELAELRRSDLDLAKRVIHVRRGVVRVDGGTLVGDPKSDAGMRDVSIPPHLVTAVLDHLREHAQWGRHGLLFPGSDGQHLAPSTLYGKAPTDTRAGNGFYAARVVAGRPDLRFHDLRHTGAVLAASTGATLAELMARLGHSTPQAALRYQHAAADRDRAIADALSRLVEDA